jgi:hypothetical protein
MLTTKMKAAIAAASLLMFALPASAEVFTLTFEGLADHASVGDFYNGGGGTNYGVSFSPATLALIDEDAGGSGNFANEPSPGTVLFFLEANNAILNKSSGFSTGFSFYYSSSKAASVNVYDGINATGNLLATLQLAAQNQDNNCVGDPTGSFCNWTAVGVTFAGIAKSIDFGGTANQVGFDNITFGTETPTAPVPEASTYGMMLAGLGVLGLTARRRKNQV